MAWITKCPRRDVAAWRGLSDLKRKSIQFRSPSANLNCCRLCATHRTIGSSSPTDSVAANRFDNAQGDTRCTRRRSFSWRCGRTRRGQAEPLQQPEQPHTTVQTEKRIWELDGLPLSNAGGRGQPPGHAPTVRPAFAQMHEFVEIAERFGIGLYPGRDLALNRGRAPHGIVDVLLKRRQRCQIQPE